MQYLVVQCVVNGRRSHLAIPAATAPRPPQNGGVESYDSTAVAAVC